MGGEINLGKICGIHIRKLGSSYDLSFKLENGTFHIVSIEDLPYLLINALSNIEDFDQTLKKITPLGITEGK